MSYVASGEYKKIMGVESVWLLINEFDCAANGTMEGIFKGMLPEVSCALAANATAKIRIPATITMKPKDELRLYSCVMTGLFTQRLERSGSSPLLAAVLNLNSRVQTRSHIGNRPREGLYKVSIRRF